MRYDAKTYQTGGFLLPNGLHMGRDSGGFAGAETKRQLHAHDTVDTDLIDRQTGKTKPVFVPVLKPENFGENRTVDDKDIGGEGYTVIANKDTGRIAVLIMSTKSGVVSDVLEKGYVPTNVPNPPRKYLNNKIWEYQETPNSENAA